MIYMDNGATTKMSSGAIQTMLPYMDKLYGNPSSLHEAGQQAAEALQAARQSMAEHLGADPGEIYFTSGGTEADNQALLTGAAIGRRQGKMHIISTAFEHHGVLHTLDALKQQGFKITLLPVGAAGVVDPAAVQAAITDETCLVSVMYVNNEIGTVQPIDQIADICRSRGVLFHTDAVQAVGHLPIDVHRQQIDMLSLSAHKFHGPKGVGALYVRRGIPVANLMHGGAQERGRRPGTENIPAIVGMAAALGEACANMEQSARYLTPLRDRLIAGLSAIPHSALNGDATRRAPGNVNMCFEGIEGESLLLMLSDMGISASSGSACTSGSLEPSHVLLAIGRPHQIAHGSLRLTLSDENTPEDVEYTIQAVTEVVQKLRDMSPLWRDLVQGKKPFVI